ncbi:MAG TPA: hypothetical protein VFW35_01765 [Sphingomicrobium sp.]|nr:hypothetical protein [Sphingomicrobium sp.]
MRAAANPVRSAWALLFALMLSLRLLGSAGVMPVLDHGSLTIEACPDADLNAPLALGTMHHHGHMRHNHAPCPYAAAAALAATGPEWTPLVAILVFGAALLLGRMLPFMERQSTRDRPPAIGPPIFPA